MLSIRRFTESDWASLLPILKATFQSGDTYAYAPDTTDEEIHRFWIEAPQVTYVATAGNDEVVGTYKLKPNQPGLGSHVCNCSYVVSPDARGKGIARILCEHSQIEAQALGYLAMQFNLVVSTNEVAVRLWQKLGFGMVGTLPGAFRHSKLGFVDAYVMYKRLATA